MFLVKNSDGFVGGNFVFSDEADACRLADALGGDVVLATVNPALVYEGGEEKTYRATFVGEDVAYFDVLPAVLSGVEVIQPIYSVGCDFLSANGGDGVVYVRASSEDEARAHAVARRAAMLAEQVARGREAVAALAERVSPDDRLEVVALLEAGRKASAAKFVREVADCGLREAVQIVDYLDGQTKEVKA